MNESKKEVSNQGGIYIILNILDCKVYVGQTRKFNNRDHMDDLEKGKDNSNLQKDYYNNEKEFVYFVACAKETWEPQALTRYEKLYMTLMEDLGFNLYNISTNRQNRTMEKLGICENEYHDAKERMAEKFLERFNIEPEGLVASKAEDRKQALEYYADKFMGGKDNKNHNLDKLPNCVGQGTIFGGDRFYFNRKRIQSILKSEERSFASLDLDEIFISKIGNYIGDGISRILKYETDAIKKHNYCLWTFANNAVSVDFIRNRCRERNRKGKNVYVLFTVTFSNVYASAEKNRQAILKKEESEKLDAEENNFLGLKAGENGDYIIPNDMDCTVAGDKSAAAFVIQEIFMLKEVNNPSLMYKFYEAVGEAGNYDLTKAGYQRSTYYIKLKDNQADCRECFTEPEHRTFSFVGKLAAPYIVKLNRE